MSDYKQVPSPEGNATSVDAALQYLTFTLGDEVFAMDIRTVREIIQHTAMTTVPLMPDFVQGVINLRGDIHDRGGKRWVTGVPHPAGSPCHRPP